MRSLHIDDAQAHRAQRPRIVEEIAGFERVGFAGADWSQVGWPEFLDGDDNAFVITEDRGDLSAGRNCAVVGDLAEYLHLQEPIRQSLNAVPINLFDFDVSR